MKGFFIVILLMISSSFGSKAQCNVTSSNSNPYTVRVFLRPIQINKTYNGGGCTYTITLEYNIYTTNSSGQVIPTNMYTLQGNVRNCMSGNTQNNFFDLPNNGGTGTTVTATGSINGVGNCDNFNLKRLCSTYELIIQGPDLNYTTVNCNYIAAGAPLPVELGSFSGNQSNNQVDLSWLTYSEHENETFFIERSTNAVDFDVIGKMDGAGTTSTQQEYFFSDKAPKNGVNYYRLRQVDFDGNEEIFDPIAVNYAGSEAFSSKVFPNPTTENKVEITLNNVQEEHVFIDTYNLLGQLLHTETIHIHSNEQTELIQLNEMEKTYLIVVRTENEILDRHRVLVQK